MRKLHIEALPLVGKLLIARFEFIRYVFKKNQTKNGMSKPPSCAAGGQKANLSRFRCYNDDEYFVWGGGDMERVQATERLVRKFARSYERGSGGARYIAAAQMELFIMDVVNKFSGTSFALRKDRGNGVTLSVRLRATREELYFTHVYNTNNRGLSRSPVMYSLTFDNTDVNFELG